MQVARWELCLSSYSKFICLKDFAAVEEITEFQISIQDWVSATGYG